MAARDDVVRALWRDLLPTAYLLTGDRTAARHLVVRTLAARRRLAGAGDRDAAVRALVRAHRSRWRLTGRVTIEGDAVVPWWASSEDISTAHELLAQLGTLDRDARTAVVLRWFEDWPPERIGVLVPGADPDAAARRLPGDPTDLRRRLDALAALCAVSTLDDVTVVGSVRAASNRRVRSVVLTVGLVPALVGAAVWVPPDRDDSVAGATATTRSAAPQGILALPPRGELVADADLVTDLRRRLSAEGLHGDDYRALYADDVEGVRVALLEQQTGTGPVQLAWLTGPAGTDAEDLQVDQAVYSNPSDLSAVAVAMPARDGVALVVLTEDGNQVTVSAGVDVDPSSGVAGRSYVDLPAPDGVATTSIDRTSDAGIRIEVGPRGNLGSGIWPVSATDPPMFSTGSGPAVPSRSGAPTASAFIRDLAVGVLTGSTGWAADDLDVVVLGSGTLDAPDSGTVEVVAVAAVLPTGAVVTTTVLGSLSTGTDGSTTMMSSTCGSSSFPAGTDLAGLVVAATCVVPSTSAADSERAAVVAAPPGHRIVLGFPTAGTPIEPALTNGFGVSPYLAREDLRTAVDGGTVFPVAGPGNDVLQG